MEVMGRYLMIAMCRVPGVLADGKITQASGSGDISAAGQLNDYQRYLSDILPQKVSRALAWRGNGAGQRLDGVPPANVRCRGGSGAGTRMR